MAERIVVVGGGVRSGKSRFAIQYALNLPGPRAFVATAQAFDAEMQHRIAAHQRERGLAFESYEAELDLAASLRAASSAQVIVVDCMTLYVSNLLLAWADPAAAQAESQTQLGLERRIAAHVEAVLSALGEVSGTVVVVTNEVGMGVVPPSPLGRSFRDLLGLANQQVAAKADEIYLAILGSVLRLKPSPLELMPAASFDAFTQVSHKL
jgi:adenosylcobinamide kinase / adenosylcobinamide-phosphate guanylyltransferase